MYGKVYGNSTTRKEFTSRNYGKCTASARHLYGTNAKVWSLLGKKSSDFPSFYKNVWKILYAL